MKGPFPRGPEETFRRTTRYEVMAELPGHRVRVGFTSRPSRSAFLRMAQAYHEALDPHLTPEDVWSYSQRDGLRLGKAVVVKMSGRTERQCYRLDRALGRARR